MSGSLRLFVGRERELSVLEQRLTQAIDGQGSMVLVSGEPGIGKSRLAEELGQLAIERGADVLWGRCWEAGGAPAFWPWLQALKQLLALRRELPPEFVGVAPRLLQVLPELQARLPGLEPPPSLEPEQARFQMLDAIGSALCYAAGQKPLVVVLEDLHAADASSLSELKFISAPLRAAPVLVLGTFREAEAQRAPVASLLGKLARETTVLPLRRWSLEQVQTYLDDAAGAAQPEALARHLLQTTEGNSLFVVELTRLLLTHGELHRVLETGAITIPGSIRLAIHERLADLSVSARAIIRILSVCGREASEELLAAVAQRSPESLAEPLEQAVELGLLEEIAPGTFRFSHILMREGAYQELSLSERQRLHARAAVALRSLNRETPWSEVAHHFLRAGDSERRSAIVALVNAAEQALGQHAPQEAVDCLEQAANLSEGDADFDPLERGALLLKLARAQTGVGDLSGSRATCQRVMELSRGRSAELFAQAALEYAAVFVYGEVDPTRVSLLEEALALLEMDETGLKPRVMARLAAAQQPCATPEKPMIVAREAVSLARRIGSPTVLLETIRAASSALMDLADPLERQALNREHIALSVELGDHVEALRGNLRLAFDCLELGDMPAVDSAIEEAAYHSRRLSHAFYQWMVAALRGLVSLIRGDFGQAEELMREAEGLALRSHDPNAQRTLFIQRVFALELQGRYAELEKLLPQVEATFQDVMGGRIYGRLWVVAYMARAGRRAEARARLDPALIQMMIDSGDLEGIDQLSDVLEAGDTKYAASLYERARRGEGRFVSGGMLALSFRGPVHRALARLSRVVGDVPRAMRHYEQALAQARGVGARPHTAWLAFEFAELLLEDSSSVDATKPSTADHPQIRSLLAEATELAGDLELVELERRCGAARQRLARSGETAPVAEPVLTNPPTEARPRTNASLTLPRAQLSMRREGELWLLECEDRSIRLKHSKGLAILAKLVAEPGREFHVLDLSAASSSAKQADLGDSGELLDSEARQAYRARVEVLRTEIEEAESFHDLGRLERARSELEFVERELSRAVGLGGRSRRAGAAAERARVNVQRRLRDTLRRIEASDPELAKHLDWAVHTGMFCSYSPK